MKADESKTPPIPPQKNRLLNQALNQTEIHRRVVSTWGISASLRPRSEVEALAEEMTAGGAWNETKIGLLSATITKSGFWKRSDWRLAMRMLGSVPPDSPYRAAAEETILGWANRNAVEKRPAALAAQGCSLFLFMGMWFYWLLFAVPTVLWRTEKRGLAAEMLGLLGSARSVDALMALRQIPKRLERLGGRHLKRRATLALFEVLPNLQPEHYPGFSPQTTPNLCLLLDDKHPGMAEEALKALGRMGSGSAYKNVELIANNSRVETMRNLAREILPVLQARLANEKASQTLLRPTNAPDAPENILLRPAQGVTTNDEAAALLLRPSHSDDVSYERET
jgi:hypothetical protein